MREVAVGGRRRRREEGAGCVWAVGDGGGALMAPADPGHCMLPVGLRAEQV